VDVDRGCALRVILGVHHETGGMEHSMPLPPLFAHEWNRFFREREETFTTECFCIPVRVTASIAMPRSSHAPCVDYLPISCHLHW